MAGFSSNDRGCSPDCHDPEVWPRSSYCYRFRDDDNCYVGDIPSS
jgi:hypothetical protein